MKTMWHIEVEKNVYLLKPIIKLSVEKYGVGLPKGEIGHSIEGYAFYELVEIKDDDGNVKEVLLGNVTVSMGKMLVLHAVTPQQLKKWSKAHVIAKPAKFIWK